MDKKDPGRGTISQILAGYKDSRAALTKLRGFSVDQSRGHSLPATYSLSRLSWEQVVAIMENPRASITYKASLFSPGIILNGGTSVYIPSKPTKPSRFEQWKADREKAKAAKRTVQEKAVKKVAKKPPRKTFSAKIKEMLGRTLRKFQR